MEADKAITDELDLDAPDESAFEHFDADQAGEKMLRFTVNGQSFEVPEDPPAEAILVVMRERLDLTDGADVARFIEVLIGPAEMKRLYEARIGIRKLLRLGMWLAQKFGFAIQQIIDQGAEALGGPPSTPPMPSSGIGGSLKPISGDSSESATPSI